MVTTTKRSNRALLLQLLSTTIIFILPQQSKANQYDFQRMLDKMAQDTLDFARHMETQLLSANKCNQDNFVTCRRGSYDDCNSEYPFASCPGGHRTIPVCGSGEEGGCAGFFDYTVSTLRLAPSIARDADGEPVEDSVKDAICYTLQSEQYMKDYTEQNMEYWSVYGVAPPPLHYGTDEGVFRIFPGNPKQPCPSIYDPRERPWYVAGSSGPKSIVLVLDTSGSMNVGRRLETMKEAAIRVIDTLGVSDYISVVYFNTNAEALSSPTLLRATKDNKDELVRLVNNFDAQGYTNFEEAFNTTFSVLEESTRKEIGLSCNNAILFLTDGEISRGGNATVVYDLIDDKISGFDDKRKPVIFTYSFGGVDIEEVPKDIACRSNGTWARILDGEDLAKSMGAYYKYFAYGLGSDRNENFVAWVQPYEFANGVGLGTTASAPVYDRSVNPPVLAGVVGLDFSLSAMEQALGDESSYGRDIIINRIVELSVASCPDLEISECQLQSLRFYGGLDGGNNETLCDGQCGDVNRISTATCDNIDYPRTFLDNKNNEGRTYEERVCCAVGETRAKNELSREEVQSLRCTEGSSSSLSTGVIAAIVVCCAGGIGAAAYFLRKKRKPDPNPSNTGGTAIAHPQPQGQEQYFDAHEGERPSLQSHTLSEREKLPVAFAVDVMPVPVPTAPPE